MALTDGERAIIVAIELMREKIVMLPLAIAQNAALAASEGARQSARDPDGGGGRGAGRAARSMALAADVAGALAARFGALLGPLASFGAILAAPTSGMSVLSAALRLFAGSVAPLILPLVFSLAVGLATAADVVFQKLLPALGDFNKAVMQTAIPAVLQMAETAGRAATALAWLADSKIGKAVLGGDASGGYFGGFNRMLDRAGAAVGLSEHPDQGRPVMDRIESAMDDLMRIVPGGSSLVGAKEGAKDATNWLGRKIGLGEAFDPARRSGAGGLSAETQLAGDRQRINAIRELQLQLMPRPQVGTGAAGVYEQVTQAAIGQSPWERDMLRNLSTVTDLLIRAANSPDGVGTLTDSDRERLERVLADRRRR